MVPLEWEYRFWTNEDCRELVTTEFPQHLAMYDNYKSNIQRADAIRYFILAKYGGVYADLDFEVGFIEQDI
jgi:mannosyltransferase OCH1-like enzyme